MSPPSATEDPKPATPEPGQWIWLSHDSRFLCYVEEVKAGRAYLRMDDLGTTAIFSLDDLSKPRGVFYGQWKLSDRNGYPHCFFGPFVVATDAEVKAYLDGESQAFRRMKQAAGAFELDRDALTSHGVIPA